MNILYWNVCNAVPAREIADQTIGLIDQYEVDVACLQEVPYHTQQQEFGYEHRPVSNLIANRLGMSAVFEHSRTLKDNGKVMKGYGTAVLSASPLLEHATTVLRTDPMAYIPAHPDNRRVLVAVRTEAYPDISIGAAHLSYAVPGLDRIGRDGREAETANLIEAVSDELDRRSLVLGGDFNREPGSALDGALEDLKMSPVGDNRRPTFCSRHLFAGYARRSYDRVYTSRGITASAVVLNRRQSDHNPLLVRIS